MMIVVELHPLPLKTVVNHLWHKQVKITIYLYLFYLNMSMDGLQTSNESIREYIKELRKKHDEGQEQIEKEENEFKKTQLEIQKYKDKELAIKNSLAKKKAIMERYTKTIKETEGAFIKILENSKTLLHVIKHENQTIIDKETFFAE